MEKKRLSPGEQMTLIRNDPKWSKQKCKSFTVCIIDDEDIFPNLLRQVIRKTRGHRVIRIKKADDVIKILAKKKLAKKKLANVIILDFVMPKKNGLEVLRDIRELEESGYFDVKIIIYTGCELPKSREVELKELSGDKEDSIIVIMKEANFDNILSAIDIFFSKCSMDKLAEEIERDRELL